MKKKLYTLLIYCFAKLCRLYLVRNNPIIIGVTGSVGKTSCREIVASVLKQNSDNKKIYTSSKNFNSELGLIFSFFEIESYSPGMKDLIKKFFYIAYKTVFSKTSYDIIVAEYGIDSPGDMDVLTFIAKPDYSILTKLDSVHSENFPGGVPELWSEKWKLPFATKKKVYFNARDSYSKKAQADLQIESESIFETDIQTKFVSNNNRVYQQFMVDEHEIMINLLDEESLHYTKLGHSIAKDLNLEISSSHIYNFDLQAGRMTFFSYLDHICIDSSYNAAPASTKKMCELTKRIRDMLYPDYKILYALGDMRELGDTTKESHEGIVPSIMNSQAVFLVGPSMKNYTIPELQKQGYTGEVYESLSSREIGQRLKDYFKEHPLEKYIILFKGSQNTIFMEETLKVLLPQSRHSKLVRQSNDWVAKKEQFFATQKQ